MTKTFSYGLLLLIALVLGSCQWGNNGSKPLKTNGENELVVLQPFDDFPDSLVTIVANGIKAKYKFDVKVLPRIPMPQENYWENDPSIYDGDKILKSFHSKLPPDAFKIIGLVTKRIRRLPNDNDIKTELNKKPKKRKKKAPKYENVAGYSTISKGWGVISSYSIYGGFFASSHRYWLANVVNHEIGHMLGLDHCNSYGECIMTPRGATIRIGDTGTFCANCRKGMQQFLLVK